MGSSPLTRGKRLKSSVSMACRGLIPAHAGKTLLTPVLRCGPGAHPRSRGENHKQDQSGQRLCGSSPLTRGKLGPFGLVVSLCRLIPAHAGKTHPRGVVRGGFWAHPRSRGENPSSVKWQTIKKGSSPLTRGKLPGENDPPARPGLIPAHAGKTPGRGRQNRIPRAHPRSRGENANPVATACTVAGSSPLTRGKRVPTHEVPTT